MILIYTREGDRLVRQPPSAPLEDAVWIDLYAPQPDQSERVAALGVEVPSLADMEEIEISNRIYHEANADYMTVVLPGMSQTKEATAGPVTFILTASRLITVRHHSPRPFETFPERANKSGTGCATPGHLFLGLAEEIVGRLADLLEGSGKVLDSVTREVFAGDKGSQPDVLQAALEKVGREGELVGRVRLALLTMERALVYFGQGADRGKDSSLKAHVKSRLRDIQALEVHADFLSGRVAHVTDTTLGLVNLSQNVTVRIVSVVAVLFLPPTVIASAYGMNFHNMPELDWYWGYPMALGMMVASAVLTYLFFKWKKWL